MSSWAGDDFKAERLPNGWINLRRDPAGYWRMKWLPDGERSGVPARTYSPADPDLPPGYPGPYDPAALLAWGRQFHQAA